ncbi:MAG: glycerate kinase [Actinomycetota bacterium]|nr:glycerate kinase [Actinomycetota bacterium]
MKAVIAPDKFKGSLSAQAVAKSIEAGLKKAVPRIETVIAPMADGGEGTIDALLAALGGTRHKVVVTGPLGESLKAEFAILPGGTAVIEMAQASGLSLVSASERDPTITTTYGTGELIEAALDTGCKRFIIGIGGSATVDAGVGLAQALGAKILQGDGSEVGFGGGELVKIEKIDASTIDPRVKGARFLVASDVENPLYGPRGAAHVFAPQKGASKDQVILLDQGLINFAKVARRDLGIDVSELPGGGAAGGLGAGLVAFLGATIKSGAELIIQETGLKNKLKEADIVITGEGQLDYQSAYGKVPVKVSQAAKEFSKTVVAIVGRFGEGYEDALKAGIDKAFSLEEVAGSFDEALKNPTPYIEKAAAQVTAEFLHSSN